MGRTGFSVLPNEELEMTTAEVTIVTELEQVEHWRAEELERGGYEPDAAAKLAARHDIDLHYAVRLLERGCSPELALQILL
jgi:hypothetical protein